MRIETLLPLGKLDPGLREPDTPLRIDRFADGARQAEAIGFVGVMSGPLVRSSYRAGRLYEQALASRGPDGAQD